MNYLLIVLIFFNLSPTGLTYDIRDSVNGLKGYIPYLLNETNEYFKSKGDFPNILDNLTDFEHLGLEDNKWVKVVPNFKSEAIRSFVIDSTQSTIFVGLENPSEYEVKGKFVYNYIILPLIGTFNAKGTITKINITFKVMPPSLNESLRIVVTNMEATFNISSVQLKPENSLIKYFEVKDLTRRVFEENFGVLSKSFIEIVKGTTLDFFKKIYPKEDQWKFSVFGNDREYCIKNVISEGRLDKEELIVKYTTSYKNEYTNHDQRELHFVRRITLGIDIAKEVILEVYNKSKSTIIDEYLPENMDNRLDIITFQKYIPDAALVSIKKHNLEDNYITLHLLPKGNLEYTSNNTETLAVTANYDYSFYNSNTMLVSGSVRVIIGVVIEWERNNTIGLLNFRVKGFRLTNLHIIEHTYPVLKEVFREFMSELTEAIGSKLKEFKLINKGIPIRDTLALYENTKRYWNNGLIIIESI